MDRGRKSRRRIAEGEKHRRGKRRKGRLAEVEEEGKKTTGRGEDKEGAGGEDWKRKRRRMNEGGRGSISKSPTKGRRSHGMLPGDKSHWRAPQS